MQAFDDDPELNITPLVDVMLVLMAILMVTAPTVTFQEELKLPDGSKSSKASDLKTLTIRMDKNQKIYLNNDTYTLDTFADDFVNQSSKFDKQSDVFIRADENLEYKNVMYLLKSVKAAGFKKVSLITL
ncbi:MAG TPA: biopolymer transporter ExbD [Sulfurovum sp.]|jgi:biopolymer transport protein ExbD|nr:MAG: biopolymer transporter ExbD [Sulfurovum sp. 35-42-20]OYZ26061.1 MAG: biopolymer transporter ExbD [Sulfurovum sp. 16-42-52]OYZ50452.1 MAG: biopolymer transporter ExbD [Sulfurovum sp. 24-42-9]OZA46004.1 MAG: biopolymer transporter ExbD [Sulfurovum sp. 17-42-90]HQS72683.1 biopolymer transporter ExbD [Sulfurovum sp.]